MITDAYVLIDQILHTEIEIVTESKIVSLLEADEETDEEENKKENPVDVTSILTKDKKDTNEQKDTDEDETINKDISLKLKWLSSRYDKLSTTATIHLKNNPKFMPMYKQILALCELYEFFINNLDHYSDDEKEEIYHIFKKALITSIEEIKQYA
jgi:hypothetical protein